MCSVAVSQKAPPLHSGRRNSAHPPLARRSVRQSSRCGTQRG
uniref:Uncharacterized protein n=1 Tax=Anguilla anguilla TaxID=7936 RepID=A0A0E9XPB8_ANGAN